MGDYKELCDLIDREIAKETAKQSLTPDTVRTIGYAVDILKDIAELKKMDMEMEQGYSGHYPERGWSVTPFYAYDNDMSMDRQSYAQRRDGMGRYMRSYDGSYRGGRGGYSRDEQIDSLRKMMDGAKNEQEREAIRKAIVTMENNG